MSNEEPKIVFRIESPKPEEVEKMLNDLQRLIFNSFCAGALLVAASTLPTIIKTGKEIYKAIKQKK